MKIIIEDEYGSCVVEEPGSDQDIYEVMDLIERVLLAKGFHINSIKEGFQNKGE